MTKKLKISLVLLGSAVLITALIVGAVLYWRLSAAPAVDQTPAANDCRTFKNQVVCTNDYLGRSESAATDRAGREGLTYRIVSHDGQGFPITMDFSAHRLNFTIENGIVTKVEFY